MVGVGRGITAVATEESVVGAVHAHADAGVHAHLERRGVVRLLLLLRGWGRGRRSRKTVNLERVELRREDVREERDAFGLDRGRDGVSVSFGVCGLEAH